MTMTITGLHVYLDQRLMQQPNHQRVVRLLREMDCHCHADRRVTTIYPAHERRADSLIPPSLAHILRQVVH